MMETHLSNQSFTDLDLPSPLLQGASNAGFEYCTPIQAESLPVALAGQDVAGQAKTGTGKTAAYLFALFAYLLRHPASANRLARQPLGLVLSPTRELAIQIHKDAQVLGRHTPYKLALIYGGTGYEKQRHMLEEGVDVLIGTPGRLIDYFKQKLFDLSALQVVVLDEADRMFDLGFIRDIRYLFRHMPPPEQRLNMLFSATLSLRVNELAYEHMNNPQVIKIESEHLTVDQVTEKIYFPSNEEKIPLLLQVLKQVGAVRTLVFVNTKYGAENVEAWLRGNDYVTGVLSGNVPQRKRERLLQDFKSGDVPVLVATDVAARGLHIPDVSHVVNFDLPQDPEDYVHRVGRTARAGASGDAVSFACETYAFSLEDIEQFIGHKIPVDTIDHKALLPPKPPVRRKRKSRHAPTKKRAEQGKRTRKSKAGGHRHVKTAHKDVGVTKSTEGEHRLKQKKKPRTTDEARKQANVKTAADKTTKTEPRGKKKPLRTRRGVKEKPAIG
jgi:ATP-dependent RNA helicase RhlB